MKRIALPGWILLLLMVVFLLPHRLHAAVSRVKYRAAGNYLLVEILDDDLVHVEYGSGEGPGTESPVRTSDMICRTTDGLPPESCLTDFAGPAAFSDNGAGLLETGDIRLQIDPDTLFLTLIDKTKNNLQLTTISPFGLNQDLKGLTATREPELDVYGLGQQFVEPGRTDFDWEGRVREGGEFGNVMAGFNGGANGNTQIPIMYAVNGAGYENYALFLDNIYRQRWDFTGQSQWKVEVDRGVLRFYLMTGADLMDLRKDFLELTGFPPVPPRKMFGLWVSEYGYDNWDELEAKRSSLDEHLFPLDGFVLDLQWFGGVPASGPFSAANPTRMGSLTFDETAPDPRFAAPQARIGELRDENGVGIMLIEEAYMGKTLSEYSELASRGCLVTDHPGGTTPDDTIPGGWWGSGAMIDYTNDDCSAFWHDFRRKPLIDKGVIGHWTDLGEPEMFNRGSGYAAGTHADSHNIFNLRWIRGIYQGYHRNGETQRPFMMSRSGAAGIQRFGAAMWSGDIGSKLDNLAAHAANQMHMSFSGIDYYGADIGGFHRGGIENEPDRRREMYTQWYAYGMLFDIPGRPHTENLYNSKQTAPDRIGDPASNLANTRLRYELIPYVYSLAHRAHRTGEPLMPPPFFYYQTDGNFRSMGGEKMIGRDLLAAVIARHGQTAAEVRLPSGTWIDWHTNERLISTPSQSLASVPTHRNHLFRVPLFAREGAIIPLMQVDGNTMNALGMRRDGSRRDELKVRVFAFDGDANDGNGQSNFTLYEDDGITTGYLEGEVAETVIAQERLDNLVTVTIGATGGSYTGAPAARDNVVELITDSVCREVTLNNASLPRFDRKEDLLAAPAGWFHDCAVKTVTVKTGPRSVTAAKELVLHLGEPCPVTCTSRLATISVPGAGNGWNPADPARTLTCEKEKIWKGSIAMADEEYKFAANGGWTVNWGAGGSQDGPNFPARPAGIYQVTFNEDDPANPRFVPEGPGPDRVSARFVCENGHTSFGTSVYVVGDAAELGEWDPAGAVKLEPDGPYPVWTGVLGDLPASTPIEWKCIKRLESGGQEVLQWEPGPNNRFTTPISGMAADQRGVF